MASEKPIVNFKYVQDGGAWYLVGIRCDGTETDAIEVPCPCDDSENLPPGTINNQWDRCQRLKFIYQSWFNPMFVNLMNFSCDYFASPDLAYFNGQVSVWMLANHVPVGYLGALNAWAITAQTNGKGSSGCGSEFDPQIIGNIMNCCFNEYATLDDATFFCVLSSLLDSPLVNELPQDQKDYLWVFRAFLTIFPVSFWQQRNFDYQATTTPPINNFDCGSFADCGGTLNCEDFNTTVIFSNDETGGWSTYASGTPQQLPGLIGAINGPGMIPVWDGSFQPRGVTSVAPTQDNLPTRGVPGAHLYFDEPVSICSFQANFVIYGNPPPDTSPHVMNTSIVGLYYQRPGETEWQLFADHRFNIAYPNARNIRWFGEPILVQHILAVHLAGGFYPSIKAVFVNVQVQP